MTTRPSCRARIQLYLDELADTALLKAALEREPPKGAAFSLGVPATTTGAAQGLEQNRAQRTRLNQSRTSIPKPQYLKELSQLDQSRAGLQARGGPGYQERPQGLKESADLERAAIFDVMPLTATLERLPMSDCGTAEMEFDYLDLPIDPRAVRGCLVSIAIGTVSADDFDAGILRNERRADGSLVSTVERFPNQELSFASSTRFVGIVDEWHVSFGEDGDKVKVRMRDLSSLFRDQILPRGVGIDLTKPIISGIREIIDVSQMTRGFGVLYGDPPLPGDPLAELQALELGPVPADSLSEVVKPKKGKQKKAPRQTDEKESIWDHIVGVCARMGLVPIIRGFTLFITEPQNLLGTQLNTRTMVWGRNVSELEFARKLGGDSGPPPTIEVRSYDPAIGRARWARYPVLDGEPRSGILGKANSPQPVVSRAAKVSPSGEPEEQVQVYRQRAGISDLSTLERIARNTFEQVARQEIEGNFKTKEITSLTLERKGFGGVEVVSSTEGDLLDLMPGDPITIDVDIEAVASGLLSAPTAKKPSDTYSTPLQEWVGRSVAQRAQHLENLGFTPVMAARLAAIQENVPLANTFRVGSVNIDWDVDEGITIGSDFYNYIVIRENPNEADQGKPVPPSNLAEAAAQAGGF